MTTADRLSKLAQDCRALARCAGTIRDRRELLDIAEQYERQALTQGGRGGVPG